MIKIADKMKLQRDHFDDMEPNTNIGIKEVYACCIIIDRDYLFKRFNRFVLKQLVHNLIAWQNEKTLSPIGD